MAAAVATPAVEPLATVRWINGTPAILRTNRWMALQVGEVIPPGATIRTAAGEMLDVTLDEPGHIISLGPESTASIDLRSASVNLDAGELVASIRKTRKEHTTVIIHSRFGDSTIRAADVRVTVTPAPTLAVLSGNVAFLPARGGITAPAMVTAGFIITATSETPALDPINANARNYLLGRIDALVSFNGPLAGTFSASNNSLLCHIPPRPLLTDPEPRAARGRGAVFGDEEREHIASLSHAGELAVHRVLGAPNCPVHTRSPRATIPSRSRGQPIPPPIRRTKSEPNPGKPGEVADPKFPGTQAP